MAWAVGELRARSAGPGNGNTLVFNSDEQLVSVLATLEQCRAVLADSDNQDTVRLLSMAILELRMKLNHIEPPELRALCDEMLRDEAAAEKPKEPGLSRRPLLRLVK